MRYNDVIHLIDMQISYDKIGNTKKIKTKKIVFANKYQVSTSEFYSDNLRHDGGQSTIRNKTAFQIRSASYDRQKQFVYQDVKYDIVRVSDLGEFLIIVGAETIGQD